MRASTLRGRALRSAEASSLILNSGLTVSSRLIRGAGVYAAFILCLLAATTSLAQTYTVLDDLTYADGERSVGPLAQGFNGDLYGATLYGGHASGTVFAVAPSGAVSVVYYVCAQSCAPNYGAYQSTGVILAPSGDFYGTTFAQGAYRYGTIFRMTPSGTVTTLHSFCSSGWPCADGRIPSGLVLGANGDIYGTTSAGGTAADADGGTIFRITPSGMFTTLHTFCNFSVCADGKMPNELIQGADGNLYGTTANGGAYGGGTAFKITPSGTLTTFYNFCSNCLDGFVPEAPLVQSASGNFYGTTARGGVQNFGTVFELTADGTLTSLYSFCSQANCADGANPETTLVIGTDGNLYGTTSSGGHSLNCDCGTLFQITPQGALTTLYVFCSGTSTQCPDGGGPAGLVQSTDGNFYGSTAFGGTVEGVVFQLSMGLGPFVETIPVFGTVGETITILGTNLTGTSGVSFSGISAAFKVVSSTEITATVPAGATAGPVAVVTSGGTLQSNVPFRLR